MFGNETEKAKISGKRNSSEELGDVGKRRKTLNGKNDTDITVRDATNDGSNNSITDSHGQNGHVNYNTKDTPETPSGQPNCPLAFTLNGEESKIKNATEQMPPSDDPDAMDFSWPTTVEAMEKTPVAVADLNPVVKEEGPNIPGSTSLRQGAQDNTIEPPGETPGQAQRRTKAESGISGTKSPIPDKPNNGGLSSSNANQTRGSTPTKDLLPLFTTPDRLSHVLIILVIHAVKAVEVILSPWVPLMTLVVSAISLMLSWIVNKYRREQDRMYRLYVCKGRQREPMINMITS
ncbi:hypothetical protein N7460_006778 [Penicillium canescens]|uniref:Uncharacterized protein n=1 Tax=Penicillium canescens TaxID=5083 RepID=A0AAD6ID24_PENCN|nr:hypothetical protein N7460_006778 [Penicillium canescens]KAJ6065836.1 hypothetical protein N7444_001489 [Penicillium canescens]